MDDDAAAIAEHAKTGVTSRALRVLRRAGWAPVLVFGVHLLASWSALYLRWPALDVPMHFGGGVAIAYFFHCALIEAVAARWLALGARELALMVFGLTCAAAVGWECAEYVSDRLLLSRAQLSLSDTLGDMLLGIGGGIAFIASAYKVKSRGTDT